jgi:hypothetical protein
MKLFVAICCLYLASVAFAKELPKRKVPLVVAPRADKPNPHDLDQVPDNIAVYEGEDVVLTCAGLTNADIESGYRVMWYEFITLPQGNPISDGNQVLPGHPNADRYSIEQPTADTFNLKITNVQGSDGGTYVCQDFNSFTPYRYKFGAQLIVILAAPNCTSSLPANGIVLEESYQTFECLVYFSGNIHPVLNFDGPPPFRQHFTNSSTSVWAGIDFYVNRSMDTRNFRCLTHFDDYFLPVPEDMSEVVPSWTHLTVTQQIFVYWPPKAMYIDGLKPTYAVGDILMCYADAFPAAFYSWQNLETLETFNTQGFTITESLVGGTFRLRCNAQNIIQGFVYTNNMFTNVTVPVPTTTTEPPTTTTPPAVSDCFDLTGHWESNDIKATLCLRVDRVNNGLTYGVIKNGTDTYYVEMYGRTDDREGQIGVTGVWPPRLKFAVASFVGECHRCYGEETLIVNAVARYSGGDCNAVGEVEYSTAYVFSRTGFNFDCMA